MSTIINGSSPSITFSDSTTQASAGLPSTGGNITGNLNVSGQVGIGTTSPSGNLDVYSSGYTKIVVGNTTNGVTGRIQTESNDFLIQTDSNHPLSFAVANGASQAGIDTSGNFKFNSGYGSSAIVYGCRAWVNFNGNGSITIYGSGNVSSVTRNSTGKYTIAYTNAMPDINYAVTTMGTLDTGSSSSSYSFLYGVLAINGVVQIKSTTQVQVMSQNASTTTADCQNYSVAIFR